MYASQPISADRARVSILGAVTAGLGVLLLAGIAIVVGAFYWSAADLERGLRQDENEVRSGADAEPGVAPGLSHRGVQEHPEIRPTAQRFLAHIKAGEFDSAYDLTSARFRENMSREELRRLAEKYPNLKNGMLLSYGRVFPERGRDETTRMRYVSPVTQVRTEVFITVAPEDEHWRIDKLVVQETRMPPGIR